VEGFQQQVQERRGERRRGAPRYPAELVAFAVKHAHAAQKAGHSFEPAERLLMNDDVAAGVIPVVGFITDAEPAAVQAHFRKIFGRDPVQYQSAKARYDALSTELSSMSASASSGDPAALTRLQELLAELGKYQGIVLFGENYGLERLQCADHTLFVDAETYALLGGSPRAVTVGVDPLLGRTAIRYFDGERSGQPALAADSGVSSAHDHDIASSTNQTGGGCNVRSPRDSALGLHEASWLLLLGLALHRRRNRKHCDCPRWA
jgi:hypothetical protein